MTSRSHFYRALGLKQIVDSPRTGYARFETAGGATFSIQIDPEEKVAATTAVYLECDDLDDAGRAAGAGRHRRSSMARATSRGCGARRGCAIPSGNIIFLYKAGEARRFPPWRIED